MSKLNELNLIVKHMLKRKIKCCSILAVPMLCPNFPLFRGGARVKPSTLDLILPFSLLNAVTLEGQGTRLKVMNGHSYSNGAGSPLGASGCFHIPLLQIPWWSASSGPLGKGIFVSYGLKISVPFFFLKKKQKTVGFVKE